MASPDLSVDPRTLAAAGWRDSDLAWERLQEAAFESHASGDRDAAGQRWGEALRLARAAFADNDPRLAASLTNQALSVRRRGNAALADELLSEALLVWDRAASWIEAMQPERRSRSSTFHLRLEAKHKGGYEQFSQERYRALAAEGRAATAAYKDGEAAGNADDGSARWQKERPAGFTDGRKLLAAVRLIAGP